MRRISFFIFISIITLILKAEVKLPAVGEQSDYLAKQKKRHWDCNIHEGRKPVH